MKSQMKNKHLVIHFFLVSEEPEVVCVYTRGAKQPGEMPSHRLVPQPGTVPGPSEKWRIPTAGRNHTQQGRVTGLNILVALSPPSSRQTCNFCRAVGLQKSFEQQKKLSAFSPANVNSDQNSARKRGGLELSGLCSNFHFWWGNVSEFVLCVGGCCGDFQKPGWDGAQSCANGSTGLQGSSSLCPDHLGQARFTHVGWAAKMEIKRRKGRHRHKINGKHTQSRVPCHQTTPSPPHINRSPFSCVVLASELYSKVGRWYPATECSQESETRGVRGARLPSR